VRNGREILALLTLERKGKARRKKLWSKGWEITLASTEAKGREKRATGEEHPGKRLKSKRHKIHLHYWRGWSKKPQRVGVMRMGLKKKGRQRKLIGGSIGGLHPKRKDTKEEYPSRSQDGGVCQGELWRNIDRGKVGMRTAKTLLFEKGRGRRSWASGREGLP